MTKRWSSTRSDLTKTKRLASRQRRMLEDMDDATLERIRDAARAPAEDDPDWETVDGPGW